MAKEKKTSEKPTAKKTAAKKSPAVKAAAPKQAAAPKKAAAPVESVAAAIAATAPANAAQHTTLPMRTAKPAPAELYDEIRRRAYEFYRERGGQHGSHEADWHRAESEVRSKYK